MSTNGKNYTLQLQEGEELSVEKRDTPKSKVYYRKVGEYREWESNSVDALEEITNFSQVELQTLKYIKRYIDGLNCFYIDKDIDQGFVYQSVNRGIRSFIQKGLVVKKHRGHYLVNPNFLVPLNKNQDEVVKAWEELSK